MNGAQATRVPNSTFKLSNKRRPSSRLRCIIERFVRRRGPRRIEIGVRFVWWNPRGNVVETSDGRTPTKFDLGPPRRYHEDRRRGPFAREKVERRGTSTAARGENVRTPIPVESGAIRSGVGSRNDDYDDDDRNFSAARYTITAVPVESSPARTARCNLLFAVALLLLVDARKFRRTWNFERSLWIFD